MMNNKTREEKQQAVQLSVVEFLIVDEQQV